MSDLTEAMTEVFDLFEAITTPDLLSLFPYVSRNNMGKALHELDARIIGKSGRSNVWSLFKYKEFRYTLRIYNTHTAHHKGIHRWDFDKDIELTLKGTMPSDSDPEVVRKFKDEVFLNGLIELNKKGILSGIPVQRIDWEERGISGVEIGNLVNKFDNRPNIDVRFVNNVGKNYTFNRTIQTVIEDFK